MKLYNIFFARSARRELQSLPVGIADRILTKIEVLETSPRPPGCTKLKGSTSLWRIRVGEYRVVYEIDDEKSVIDIVVIRHRSEAYK